MLGSDDGSTESLTYGPDDDKADGVVEDTTLGTTNGNKLGRPLGTTDGNDDG